MAKHLMKCPICKLQFDRNAEPFVVLNKTRVAHVRCAKIYCAEKGKDMPEIINPKVSRLCEFCRHSIPIDEARPLEGFDRWAHIDCLNEENNRETTSKEKLMKYIQQIYDLDAGSTSFQAKLKQANEMVEKKGMTYSGIHGTLKYFVEVKKQSIKNSDYLGIVPFIYDEAKEYYKRMKEINNYNSKFKLNNFQPKEVSVKFRDTSKTVERKFKSLEEDEDIE